MSHNSKYYVKKVPKVVKNNYKIDSFFSQPSASLSTENKNASEALAPCTIITTSSLTCDPAPSTCSTTSLIGTPTLSCDPAPSCTTTSSLVDTPSLPCAPDSEVSDSHSDTEESDDECDTEFLTPDQRVFSGAKYEQTFKWLYYSVSKNGYCCKTCEMFSPSSSISGQSIAFIERGVVLGTHPSRKLQKHEKSDRHNEALERFAYTKALPPSKKRKTVHAMLLTSEAKQKDVTVKKNREYMKKVINCLYFMIQKRWAVTENLEDLVRFVADLGVADIAEHLADNNSINYLSSTAVTEMISAVSDYIETDILDSLKSAKYYALLADESTDESNRTQFAILAKWSHKSTVSEHYLGLIHVRKTDAESLMAAIEGFLLAKGVDITKARFVGFDGTNTMSGEISGLQRRFRHISPLCHYINCRNHRLALCIKHLMKDYPILLDVDSTLLGLWKLFEYSPQKFVMFSDLQETYGLKGLALVKAAATRWLSHEKACIRVAQRYVQILDLLDEVYQAKREPEIYGLRATVTRKDIVVMILCLCDILAPLGRLSLYLQGSINFTHVTHQVQGVIDQLHTLIDRMRQDDPDLYTYKVDEFLTEIDQRTDLARRQRIHIQVDHLQKNQFLEEVVIPFIYSLVGELDDAFRNSPLLQAFGVLDPRNLPRDMQQLADYGSDGFVTLATHYGTPKEDTFRGHVQRCNGDIDLVVAQGEFRAFKHQMYIFRENNQANTTDELLHQMELNDAMRNVFPNIYFLLYMSVIIPTSTACVERTFSLMNSLCTPLRNRLTEGSLDALMRVCAEGPEVLSDNDLESIVDIFKNLKPRKLEL